VIETATTIVQRLQRAGHQAWFAGGCVRDMVMGVTPHDVDIATSATPDQIQQLFAHTIPVGVQFGVVIVLDRGHQFEVATFRSDDAYEDGRRPTSVRYGSAEQDAHRRDFTINGLFYDPVTRTTIDYVNGQQDIQQRVIRTIGNPRDRFTEDKLRLLRCVRFAANLGFEIAPETFDVVREMAAGIRMVSAERTRDELIKLFTRPHAGRGLELLESSGLLREILPEASAMVGVEQPPQFHPEGDVFTHVRMMLDALPTNPSVTLAFAVLLHDIGKPPTFTRATDRIRFNEHDVVGAEMTGQILRRLRFPNETIEQVTVCVAEHMRMRHVQDMRTSKLKRLLARPTLPDELELHRLDCEAAHGDVANYHFLKRKIAEIPPEAVRPKPLVTGHDLLAIGYKAEPRLGRVLREIEELQLDDQLKTRDDAIAFALKRLREPS
jgi:poly(A) polymerase